MRTVQRGQSRRVVVTGGAGFLGSHLCEALLGDDEVVCVDNLSTSDGTNIERLLGHKRFEFHHADITSGLEIDGQVDTIVHLASPASPADYLRLPIETLAVGSRGTESCLALAEKNDARLIFASTSEVYGDPLVHPQTESYWGNVNPIGPRSVYDESKRFAEALLMAHARERGARVGIVRIFNTYGPRLRPSDGRVVSNFVVSALRAEPLTVYGDGSQTRSLCYVGDTVNGLRAMMAADGLTGPINLGNPNEITMAELAVLVRSLAESTSPIVHAPLPIDDPVRRRPDTSLAGALLGWFPTVDLADGLVRTIEWFRAGKSGQSIQTVLALANSLIPGSESSRP
jgi:dTDP-glucose 4,6-dehydratase